MTGAHRTRTHLKVISLTLKVKPWLRYLNISHQVQIHRLEDMVVCLKNPFNKPLALVCRTIFRKAKESGLCLPLSGEGEQVDAMIKEVMATLRAGRSNYDNSVN
ncbi:hypothetical protein GLOIN_2v1778911 [Rhizophagus irregularis DAOM 181602=DAOM 197198]|nr:hypothetical protein GLOIN_2v1778911 [Rhizophagus irregularis DAOM 181602=DAOM 197198]